MTSADLAMRITPFRPAGNSAGDGTSLRRRGAAGMPARPPWSVLRPLKVCLLSSLSSLLLRIRRAFLMDIGCAASLHRGSCASTGSVKRDCTRQAAARPHGQHCARPGGRRDLQLPGASRTGFWEHMHVQTAAFGMRAMHPLS